MNEIPHRVKSKRGELPMDSARKFALVESQIRQAMLGSLDCLACPYCFSNVELGVERLCCEPLGDAAAAVLRRWETAHAGATIH